MELPELQTIRVQDADSINLTSITDIDDKALSRFVADPANILIAGVVGGQVAGVLRAHRLSRYDGRGDEVLLNEIDVDPTFRKQGIATRLVEHLKEVARETGCSEIWIPTNTSNDAAMRLYAKTGFTRTHADDVIMQFDLR